MLVSKRPVGERLQATNLKQQGIQLSDRVSHTLVAAVASASKIDAKVAHLDIAMHTPCLVHSLQAAGDIVEHVQDGWKWTCSLAPPATRTSLVPSAAGTALQNCRILPEEASKNKSRRPNRVFDQPGRALFQGCSALHHHERGKHESTPGHESLLCIVVCLQQRRKRESDLRMLVQLQLKFEVFLMQE